MSSSTGAAETWIYGKLANDATLTSLGVRGIYAYQAPETATVPYIVFQQQAASDVPALGTIRIMTSLLYVVRVISTAPFSSLLAIDNRIDALLHASSGTNSNGTVIACVRQSPFVMSEPVEGRTFRHLGGIYRLWAQ